MLPLPAVLEEDEASPLPFPFGTAGAGALAVVDLGALDLDAGFSAAAFLTGTAHSQLWTRIVVLTCCFVPLFCFGLTCFSRGKMKQALSLDSAQGIVKAATLYARADYVFIK